MKAGADSGGATVGGPAGLYVHVPFCMRKCAYCAFYSVGGGEARFGDAWLAGVKRELAGLPEGWKAGSVFFGGGTPSALEEGRLAAALEAAGERTEEGAEWTVEANPGTLTAGKLRRMRDAGVNRLSLGVQSFDDSVLARLGRIHRAEEARRAVEAAREAGFGNVGVDLIYGWAGCGEREAAADAEAAVALGVEHVSAYCLEVEEGTELWRRRAVGERVEEDDEGQWRAYRRICDVLAAAGYGRYEISNFARPGRECRHNLLYWSGGEYFGVGPGAHSHWAGERFGNTAELPEWRVEFRERLDPEAKARETLVMGLRRTRGWRREEFRATTGFDFMALRGEEIEKLAAEGALVWDGERLCLAEEWIFQSDSVFSELV